MINLKFEHYLLKVTLVLALSILVFNTTFAEINWDLPTDCDRNDKRSIDVWVRDVKAGLYKIKAYKGAQLFHTGNDRRIYEFEFQKKRITLGSVPFGKYNLVLERDGVYVTSKEVAFKACIDGSEDTIVWADEATDCNNNQRSVSVKVTNKSNKSYDYKLELFDQSGGFISNDIQSIHKDNYKHLSAKTKLNQSKNRIEARLVRGSEIISIKRYVISSCGKFAPDEVEWANQPSNCDQHKRRSVEALVTNNSNTRKKYKIKVFQQAHNHLDKNANTVHEGANIYIAAKSKRLIKLSGIPSGYFKVQMVSEADVIGSTNYIFENCNISSTEISKLTQIKSFEPFFTKLEKPFSINLADYFKSNNCNTITYSFKKLGPGITHELLANVLTITPTPSFLGKSLLKITAICDNKKIVENITIHTQLPANLLRKCNLQTVNVGVLNFDPVMPNYENRLLHEVYSNWNNPFEHSEKYIEAITKASGDYIYFNLVEWSYFNEFPEKKDAARFTPESYAEFITKKLKKPGGHIDYAKIVQEYGMVDLVNQKQVDEVWLV